MRRVYVGTVKQILQQTVFVASFGLTVKLL